MFITGTSVGFSGFTHTHTHSHCLLPGVCVCVCVCKHETCLGCVGCTFPCPFLALISLCSMLSEEGCYTVKELLVYAERIVMKIVSVCPSPSSV